MKSFKMTPNKLMIALFAVVLGGTSLATAILPKKEKSENENRYLEQMPSVVNTKKLESAENFADVWDSVKWQYINSRDGNAFKDDFEAFLCDHLAGRETWVKASNGIQRLSGKQEINGVYTVDDQMIQLLKPFDQEQFYENINAINAFAERFPEKQMFMMIAPTVQELYTNKIPGYMDVISERAVIETAYHAVANVGAIDCRSYLSGTEDKYVYYRTDHHWTSLGAYYAYQSAAKALGYAAYGYNSFNIETVSRDFRGTLYSKTLDDSVTPDNIEYFTLAKNEPKIRMTCSDGDKVTEYDSLYVRDFLNEKDKYSSFTGSNVPLVTIETDVDNDKKLLIIKDSYAHSLAPFLANHYSKIAMVDLRYIGTDLRQLIDFDEYSQVLFMYNAATFVEDGNLTKLGLTK